MDNLYNPKKMSRNLLGKRGFLVGIILLVALVAFEAFNFSTTQVALADLLGSLSFAGFSWATILAVAFCGIDFAGIARLFLPEDQFNQLRNDTWYLFGAWLLAATMNAMLTWWGVSLALVNRTLHSTAFIKMDILVEIVPIFIALAVWLTRILLIGTFSIAGPRLFSTAARPVQSFTGLAPRVDNSPLIAVPAPPVHTSRPPVRPSHLTPTSQPRRAEVEYVPDPTYVPLVSAAHSLSGRAKPSQSSEPKSKF